MTAKIIVCGYFVLATTGNLIALGGNLASGKNDRSIPADFIAGIMHAGFALVTAYCL